MASIHREYDSVILRNRRALEAVRNGVPNKEAVEVLGVNQPNLEMEFEKLLNSISGPSDGVVTSGKGLTVAGAFGVGKSHILQHFENEALGKHFVCSRISINKQSPLYDLGTLFRNAIDNAQIPGRTSGRFIEELVGGSWTQSAEFASLFKWVNQDEAASDLNQIFAASLDVYANTASVDEKLRRDLTDFWAGHRIKVSTVNAGLRQAGRRQFYSYRAPRQADLPPQHFRFALELIKSMGYKGWIILLDEVETISTYTKNQRGRSYAELARLMGAAPDEQYPGMATVAAITEDYHPVMIAGKDIHEIPMLLRGKEEERMAARATAGMNLLGPQSRIPITELTDEDWSNVIEELRTVYSSAYQWEAPPLPEDGLNEGKNFLQRRIRLRVRAAVNSWDLMRLRPGSEPQMEIDDTYHERYEEEADMEITVQDDQD